MHLSLRDKITHFQGRIIMWVALLAAAAPLALRADSVVVFNEIMYHPLTNETGLEWLELHNQMAVDVDMSGWSITGGIGCQFPEGTVIRGDGYLVIAAAPVELMAATGLTNVLGPFTGRLSNAGDRLQLLNNNQRLMDAVNYGVDGDWPVGPDGSGVSLAKQDEDSASGPARNWTVSAFVGGTPGRRNFALKSFEVTNSTPVTISSRWKYDASGNVGAGWLRNEFDDSAWASGPGLFQAGNVVPPLGDRQALPTVFSSGVDASGVVLGPGAADPHYWLTQSAQSTPPPPPIAATVIQNHPAWAANDSLSSWIGPVNPGTANIAAGIYNYRTTFTLDGFDPAMASLTVSVGADNRLNDVALNGTSKGISYVGFATLSGDFLITNGFTTGTNTLDFLTANDTTSPNPGGFRARLAGTARQWLPSRTTLAADRTNYCFRANFLLNSPPQYAAVKLNAVVADGAVFYLNGAEVLRLNMPPGPVNASTLALTNVPSPAFLGPFTLPSNALIAGTNVLAVELHPAAGSVHDVLFGAELLLAATNMLVPTPVALAFNEIASATNTDFWIELINYGLTNLDLDGCMLVRHGGVTTREYMFPAQILAPGAAVSVSKTTLGFSADPGDRLFLYGRGRDRVLDAVVAKREPRGCWPDGSGRWWHPALPTPGDSNSFAIHEEVVINEIMYHPPPLPPVPAEYAEATLLPITARWRYQQAGANLAAGWVAPDFNDRSWSEGPALFYVEDAALPAPKSTPLLIGPVTYYFRTTFVFNASTNGLELRLRTVLDDGAVFYLNGREIQRVNMRDGDFNYLTLAWPSVTDATYLGPFVLPITNLLIGTNVLAVEVHQAATNSTDVVFGAELVASYQSSPGTFLQEPPEAWVELFNCGSNMVDLAGWQLSHDLDFHFPPGTAIPGGGYLVVAKDVAYLQSNYPGIMVVGPFTNSLRHSSSHLLLLDPDGNPADEVRYFDGQPWPQYADGSGSSIELRDPWADNAKPEAWAASLESQRSVWTNCTYRAVASNLLGPTLWKEFVIGLLDEGECLIDDLSVVESPSGTPVSLLQNGNFEAGFTAWRALGNHSHSRIEVDPDNPTNHILHLIATGPVEHIHNHLETTFAGGRSVVDGREYQISFRAKWLAGNNRLNTRLYFNRAAKTTSLPRPLRHGTPGMRNSTWAPNLGPTFATFSHSPVIPKANETVTVNAWASDPDGISAMMLWWSANSGKWNTTPMQPAWASVEPGYVNYTAVLPGHSGGTLVQFFVQAVDRLGAVSAYPAGGTNSRALFKIDEGKPLMSQLHRFRLLMLPADASILHAPTNVMSNDRIGLTVVYDERQVFYDVGIHLQSSERGRNDSSRVGFTVRLHADQLFRGVQNVFTIDRSGGYSGRGGRQDEILLWHAVNHAGGILGLNNDLVQVFAPRAQEDSPGMLRMSAFDADYFDGQYQHGADGNLYTLELIYYPTTTTSGDPQAPKLPQPDDVLNVEIQDRGNDPENYRWIFLQENHADLDDYSQVIALNKAFSLTGAALENRTSQLMDADEWMRALAFKAFTGDADTFTYGLNHNWKIYFRPEDGKALGLLWDMDYSFAQSIGYTSPGSGSANTYKITMLPNNYRRYYNHLLDLMTTTVNSSYLSPWAAHYAKLVGQDWSGAVSYLQQRADYLRATMPLATPFAITSNSGNNFSTTSNRVTLAGTAPLTVKDIEVNGLRYPLTWTSLTNWTLTVPLPGYFNFMALQGLNNYGSRPVNATDSIVVTNPSVPALQPVVINEWMADNSDPGGFPDPANNRFSDWFELHNPNPVPVNLAGWLLTDTISQPDKWRIPTNTVIAATGFLLVWADNQTNLNGSGIRGDLHANFQLSKNGDFIGLYMPDGTPRHTVAYEPQFQNVSQGLFPDGNTNAFHFMTNWSPRAANQLGPPASPRIIAVEVPVTGTVSISFSAIPGRTYRVEYKDDLSAPAWTPVEGGRQATGSLLIMADDLGDQPQRFYRIVLVP